VALLIYLNPARQSAGSDGNQDPHEATEGALEDVIDGTAITTFRPLSGAVGSRAPAVCAALHEVLPSSSGCRQAAPGIIRCLPRWSLGVSTN